MLFITGHILDQGIIFILSKVLASTLPVALRLLVVWYRRTAPSVIGPYEPSTFPESKPEFFKICWIAFTSSPLEPTPSSRLNRVLVNVEAVSDTEESFSVELPDVQLLARVIPLGQSCPVSTVGAILQLLAMVLPLGQIVPES